MQGLRLSRISPYKYVTPPILIAQSHENNQCSNRLSVFGSNEMSIFLKGNVDD